MMGGVAEKLIPPQHHRALWGGADFTTYADNQTGFDLHVVQGERELVADCRSLARFKLTGIPPMPAAWRACKSPSWSTPMACSACRRAKRHGQGSSIRVKPSYGLSDDEVERMIRDSLPMPSRT